MDIVDPVGSSAATSRSLAARPASLEGVTIALLDNSKPNAKELLERLGALLAAQAGARGAPSDLDEFQGWRMEQGWGDGLPAIPPTAERVKRMLAGTRREPEEIVAVLVPRLGRATIETVAANAVMAGALPEHMPVILAAVEALANPSFNLQAVQTTTHPCSPLLIVNGPIARRLGINAAGNALGQGARANAVIGRAVRLTLQNIGGARPGKEDRATHGHPGKD